MKNQFSFSIWYSFDLYKLIGDFFIHVEKEIHERDHKKIARWE